MGRFEDGVDRVTLDAGDGIYLLESDVNELAQAKGANVAGLQVVFRHVRRRRSTTSTCSTWPAASAGI